MLIPVAAPLVADDTPVSRRVLLGGLAGLTAMLLAGCSDQEEVTPASATLGSNRTNFKDMVGWVSQNAATIAFLPFMLDDIQRESVISAKGVYPALPASHPMVELRLELAPDRDQSIPDVKIENLSAVQLTFWHFDNPAAVVREERRDWTSAADISLVGLSGETRRNGWAVGTVRGQRVVSSRVGNQAYTWNLGFQLSLS